MAAAAPPDRAEDASPPPRKRLRVDQAATPAAQEPRLFAPFRALGLITNHVPFVLQTRSYKGQTDGPSLHLVTCLGKAWAMWEGGKMTLQFVGPDAQEPISCLAMEGKAVWAAAGPDVIKYLRGKEVARLSNPLGSPISFILIFGTQMLALTEDGKRMLAWDTNELKLQSMMEFEPGFTATSILHPSTYLNKVLVGSSQGNMQLWNIRTQTCIHKFSSASLLTSPSGSQDGSPVAITALAQSPAIDVVGIGFASGEISVYDVRMDERLLRMKMQDGAVRALSFRTDGHPILATASANGHMALWDLNAGGRLLHIVRGAHDGAISAVQWVPGQPLLVSSGEDNSVKQWLFDSPTAAPRLLKFRSGHHAPPHLIRYYGDDGKQLLTAARDRSLRCTSVVRDSRSFELSQGALAKKAAGLAVPAASLKCAPVAALAHSTTRAKDWDDVLTAHADDAVARTWTLRDKRLGKHAFAAAPERARGAPAPAVKAVCVSACGNFGLVAASTGAVQMYNMQSGIRRKAFDVGAAPDAVKQRAGAKRKERCVTGLATDALNRVVVASTLDGTLNFFDFHTAELQHTLVLPSSAVSITLHRDSGLLAVICDDLTVRLVDIETRRIVREFSGFRSRVLDLTFSPDARWIITTSLDSIIRTFDIPTGCLIDAFRTSSVATSVSFSPTNDFLATAHVDSVGVYLWANRAQYSDVAFHGIAEDAVADVALPSVQGEAEDDALAALAALRVADAAPADVFTTPPQLDGELVTLTLLPRARWQTLLNLEVITRRNKPKEPPKPPEAAPFFLPTLPGVEHRFDVAQAAQKEGSAKSTRRLERAAAAAESVFVQKLEAEDEDGDYESFYAHAKTLSPAALDVELRALVTLGAQRRFLRALVQRLRSHRDFEMVQALESVFLRVHGEVLVANAELRAELERLADVQRRESGRVVELLASSLGTLAFVRDVV
ncbi:WD40 and Utp21 domain-containing protein [Phanerochaete sordida]|uniref:WD40 and Utp21 domain-containing protein n=1 Tax=Phanerochaete sordida TaxID=48140 RepID=A0A9P3G9I9_9APHY|nr:WD40 and Utp21 domain-containing protein [Phanerochaete sordida]